MVKKEKNIVERTDTQEEFYRHSISAMLDDIFLGRARKRKHQEIRKLNRSQRQITTVLDGKDIERGWLERLWNRFHISTASMVKASLSTFRADVSLALQKGPIHFSQANGFSGQGFQALPSDVQKVLYEWHQEYVQEYKQFQKIVEEKEMEEYQALSFGVLGGWSVGLIAGWLLDTFVKGLNPVLEGVTRFIAGAGDTIGGMLTTFWGTITGKPKEPTKEISSARQFIIGSMLGTLWWYAHRIQRGIRKSALSLLRVRKSLVNLVEE